jgi:2-iminobutanoate/2-iminopropanoate deaminase
MKAIREIPGAPQPVGPYSPAIKSGGFLFCAGQIGLDPNSMTIVEGGVEAQTKRVLENLKAVLAASSLTFSSVVMTTIFLTDIKDGKVVNEIYAQYVNPDSPPARQTVAVKELPLNALVEISVIAEAAV